MTYIGSTVIPTSSSLEMIQVLWAFSPGNRDQSVEVSAEINGSFKFGIVVVLRFYGFLTSNPALVHDPGFHTCRMKENPPRYPHTKYEKFLISSCRVISNQKPSK